MLEEVDWVLLNQTLHWKTCSLFVEGLDDNEEAVQEVSGQDGL